MQYHESNQERRVRSWITAAALSEHQMSRFSIRNPYFIIVVCLVLMVIGVTSLARMPVDLFPTINLPEVVVATFYSGMPPQDIETDITDPLERFFTLASGIDHMESRSLLGVSIIKVYFQPGTNADADVTELSNLALADLKRLPPGHTAAGRAEVRCLQPAGLPGDPEGRGTEPNAASRHWPIHHPQSDRGGEGSGDSAAVWRQVPPDHGVRRSVQAGVAAVESDGRRARGEQLQPDSARGRRQDRPLRLLRLLEQPGRQHGGTRQSCRSRPWEAPGSRSTTSAKPRTPTRFSTTSCEWMGSGPSISRS